MELVNYLNKHFLTREQLIQATQISEQQLQGYQSEGVMPKPSYQLNIQLNCNSFLGPHNQKQDTEYYAKGYCSWIGAIKVTANLEAIYRHFYDRYTAKLTQLHNLGYESNNPKLSSGIDEHIGEEWGYFIQGTYGLCTRSGLPEDIAAKELATMEINKLLEYDNLSQQQIQQLNYFVDLLDAHSSLFAPHERIKSSRHRLIDHVRQDFNLQ
ncbi:DUF6058 family natural product biosynthesis protein [Microbulbifer sp. OS29]|uniref:DUF6058 family natural product biosynthesis protein n=1 Tax=Microbulbifer okhotskensis TaxID=2926617 RepID=A0A9X2J6K1_9GAMM|nr:DUF6058 family natural product biosynthesis protein [Microbulbifer okhotskensis]MCO1335489.1 DUF6058 family natural product biosynthesis protein [Microbulbifer okhotskensis]